LHIAGAGREVIALEVDLDHVRDARERGWNGLGQTLKSFRDADIRFPAYQANARKGGVLGTLGSLQRPAARSR
jgi:hypothetical protein